VPAVQGGLRRHAVPGQHVAGDPLGVPGGGLGAASSLRRPTLRRWLPLAGAFAAGAGLAALARKRRHA